MSSVEDSFKGKDKKGWNLEDSIYISTLPQYLFVLYVRYKVLSQCLSTSSQEALVWSVS